MRGPYLCVQPARTVNGICALTNGLWLDLLLEGATFTPEEALQTVYLFLAGLFPKHLSRHYGVNLYDR